MNSCVRDVMTTRVVTAGKTASFKEMIVSMRKARISALPVVDDRGHLVGVVSQADMLDSEADLATGAGSLSSVLRFGDQEKAARVTAADLMTSPPVTAGPDTPLAEAARLMRDHRVKRLPVTDTAGRLIGIVSRSDVLSVFTRPDADIRREAAEEMIAESLMLDTRELGVTVHDGIVTLTGRPETRQAGRDLVEAVRRIDGVVAVRDELHYAGTPR